MTPVTLPDLAGYCWHAAGDWIRPGPPVDKRESRLHRPWKSLSR